MLRLLVASFLAVVLSACTAAGTRVSESKATSLVQVSVPNSGGESVKPLQEKFLIPAPTVQPPVSAAQASVASIHFSPEGTELDDSSMHLLLAHAARLKEHPRQVLTLVSHTENLGSSSYELAVAEEEINVVTGLLRSFGVPARQIRHQRGVAIKAAIPCTSVACRQQARNVDLIYD